jgi:hypothetical protein
VWAVSSPQSSHLNQSTTTLGDSQDGHARDSGTAEHYRNSRTVLVGGEGWNIAHEPLGNEEYLFHKSGRLSRETVAGPNSDD